jgi:hypothetical protein
MKHIHHYQRRETNFIIVINEIKTFPSADFPLHSRSFPAKCGKLQTIKGHYYVIFIEIMLFGQFETV